MLNFANSLVVYFSYSNNTKVIAELIGQETGATLKRILGDPPYPNDYSLTVADVLQQNRKHEFPNIEEFGLDLRRYPVLFLGFPIWDMRLPPPVRTFLRDNDCAGKVIIPFFMHSGFGGGKSVKEIKEFCSRCTILPSFSTTNSKAPNNPAKIRTWLKSVVQELGVRLNQQALSFKIQKEIKSETSR
jgi:flavodoxin